MKTLTIIKKKYQRNLPNWQINTIYFKIDNQEFVIDIVYMNNLKQNVFVFGNKITNTLSVIKNFYNLSDDEIKEFGNYFLHKLRCYSKYSVKGPDSFNYPKWIR